MCTGQLGLKDCAPGGKLKRPWLEAPIHSPTSLALAREVLSPTMRSGVSSWLLMKRMRDVIICMAPNPVVRGRLLRQGCLAYHASTHCGKVDGRSCCSHHIAFPWHVVPST